MHHPTKALLTALTAAIVLAAAVGTANARRIELSSQSFRAVWSSAITGFQNLTFESSEGGARAICPVTLEGSFHSRTLSKVSGQLIGYVTKAALTRSACTFAGLARDVSILTETLPWHILYLRFGGTLPTITEIEISLRKASFLLTGEAFGVRVSCLYEATTENPAFGVIRVSSGTVTGIRAEETRTNLLLHSGGLGCPGEGTFKGLGKATVQGSDTTSITVRLVQ